MVFPAHLVGREREVAALTDVLGGSARACLVHGATGMGKSALLAVASSIAVRSGLRPVRGPRAVSGTSTVVVVDDVEQLSFEELQRLSGFPGVVVLGGDVDPAAPPDGLAELVADAVPVPLRPLDAGSAAELIRRRFDDATPELIALCSDYSGGAPGVLSDVLDLVAPGDLDRLRDRLPGLRLPRLLRAVRRWWDVLDADTVAVARALAVLGNASLDVLGEVAGMGSYDTLAAFERLVDARLAVDDPMGMWSPALRCAVRHEMTPESRERLHRTAAEVLHRRSDTATAVSEHLVACAEPVGAPWASPALRAAARLHRAAGRPENAMRCLRAALRESGSTEQVAVAMADLYLRCGIAPRASELAQLWQRLSAEGNPNSALDWLVAVVVDWQCDEDVLGVAEEAFSVATTFPEQLEDGAPLVMAGDWLVALEMWDHLANGDHGEVSRLMLHFAGMSSARGCVALAAAAFVASCVDTGRPVEAQETLGRLGYAGTLPPAWVCQILLRYRARMHLALGAPRAAMADAALVGATEELDQARAALAGPARRTVRGVAWGKLTPHEERIVRLALDGETNRAIAARFNVTQRAVELHLTRVYRKVGICRRVQLSSVFGI